MMSTNGIAYIYYAQLCHDPLMIGNFKSRKF